MKWKVEIKVRIGLKARNHRMKNESRTESDCVCVCGCERVMRNESSFRKSMTFQIIPQLHCFTYKCACVRVCPFVGICQLTLGRVLFGAIAPTYSSSNGATFRVHHVQHIPTYAIISRSPDQSIWELGEIAARRSKWHSATASYDGVLFTPVAVPISLMELSNLRVAQLTAA